MIVAVEDATVIDHFQTTSRQFYHNAQNLQSHGRIDRGSITFG